MMSWTPIIKKTKLKSKHMYKNLIINDTGCEIHTEGWNWGRKLIIVNDYGFWIYDTWRCQDFSQLLLPCSSIYCLLFLCFNFLTNWYSRLHSINDTNKLTPIFLNFIIIWRIYSLWSNFCQFTSYNIQIGIDLNFISFVNFGESK